MRHHLLSLCKRPVEVWCSTILTNNELKVAKSPKNSKEPTEEGSEKTQGQILGLRQVKVVVGLSSMQHCHRHTETGHTDLLKTVFSPIVYHRMELSEYSKRLKNAREVSGEVFFSFTLLWSKIARYFSFAWALAAVERVSLVAIGFHDTINIFRWKSSKLCLLTQTFIECFLSDQEKLGVIAKT